MSVPGIVLALALLLLAMGFALLGAYALYWAIYAPPGQTVSECIYVFCCRYPIVPTVAFGFPFGIICIFIGHLLWPVR